MKSWGLDIYISNHEQIHSISVSAADAVACNVAADSKRCGYR